MTQFAPKFVRKMSWKQLLNMFTLKVYFVGAKSLFYRYHHHSVIVIAFLIQRQHILCHYLQTDILILCNCIVCVYDSTLNDDKSNYFSKKKGSQIPIRTILIHALKAIKQPKYQRLAQHVKAIFIFLCINLIAKIICWNVGHTKRIKMRIQTKNQRRIVVDRKTPATLTNYV